MTTAAMERLRQIMDCGEARRDISQGQRGAGSR